MVKHIVFWNLKDQANGMDKVANANTIKERLETLNGRIPGLIRIEVGLDFLHSADSYDLALYSEFSDREALKAYQEHELHKAIMPFIAEAKLERKVVDYEI